MSIYFLSDKGGIQAIVWHRAIFDPLAPMLLISPKHPRSLLLSSLCRSSNALMNAESFGKLHKSNGA